jgi:hypothetical protein
MTSLEGVPHQPVRGADLPIPLARDDRRCPLVTLANGTAMAR